VSISATKAHHDFDPAKAEAFAGRFLTALKQGALCVMVSIGHRTGLFDGLRTLPPSPAEEIVAKAGLHQRYVREWLGAMATAGVVEVDPATERFALPAEHAACLTRAAAADHLAVFAQDIAGLGGVEDDIGACLQRGGGVPYEQYWRFHDVMAEDSGQSVLASREAHILPLVPGLTDRLARGLRMLDAGCGRGCIITQLAQRYPNSRFTGIDLSPEAIASARNTASAKGLRNLEVVAADLSDFDATAAAEACDLRTTCDAVHDQAQPLRVLRGIHRARKADGVYLMQDLAASSYVRNTLAQPLGTFLYTVSCMPCMTVSLAQGGEGLGALWGEEKTRASLRRAGFRSIETHRLAHDLQN
jgi:SAM-dependent methyltransferase